MREEIYVVNHLGSGQSTLEKCRENTRLRLRILKLLNLAVILYYSYFQFQKFVEIFEICASTDSSLEYARHLAPNKHTETFIQSNDLPLNLFSLSLTSNVRNRLEKP